MTAKENLESYKVMVNFNQDLIKNTETLVLLNLWVFHLGVEKWVLVVCRNNTHSWILVFRIWFM